MTVYCPLCAAANDAAWLYCWFCDYHLTRGTWNSRATVELQTAERAPIVTADRISLEEDSET